MPCYLLEPQSPLVFRSGKPFATGAEGDTLPFPLPSTLAGALRTAYAEATAQGAPVDYRARQSELLAVTVQGPLLVRRRLDQGSIERLFPKPADAVYLNTLRRLKPGALPRGADCDLPSGLLPVFLETDDRAKPQPGPAFWAEPAMQSWLQDQDPGPLEPGGSAPLPVDIRTHVGLDPKTLAADPGRLFQSAGLDGGPLRRPATIRGWAGHTYALLAHCTAGLPATWRRLGGEGRLVRVEPLADIAWPTTCRSTLASTLKKARGLRLILATPALFAAGWKPGWLDDRLEGAPHGCPELRLRLRAVALDRWQAVSGWDLAAGGPGKPRAVRRLVPAGAVYWFKVLSGAEHAPDLWLHAVSDHEQDRRDGFGLALPGIWNDVQ